MASFATPAELAAFANTPLDTSRMQVLLDLASGLIRGYTGLRLSETFGSQVEFGPTDSTLLVLPEVPVTAVSDVQVNAVTITAYTWGRWGNVVGDVAWIDGALITYDHGYSATSWEISELKGVCLAVASRAFTMNERSASEVMGSTLMEAAGYSPEVFLTDGEKHRLDSFMLVAVG